MLSGESQLIGLDIGTSGIRLVQAKNAGGRAKLVTYGAVALEAKVMASDAQIDRQQVMAATKKLLEDSHVSAKNVVAGLPSSKVFASLITLPKMSEAELDKAVAYQAEQYVPMALNQVKLDWMVVANASDKQVDVLLVAVPITLSERYLNMLESIGLEVVALEPDATALARALASNAQDAAVVLDVGSEATDLVIIYGGTPRVIRSIPVGGDSFVRAAAQTLNLEAEQAYQFVYKFGLAESKLEGQVKQALKSSIDNLVSEVDKSVKFFQTHYKEAKLAKLVLTGKASLVPEFPAHLANSLNLPVEIGNPWSHFEIGGDLQAGAMEVANQFAVAAGLSLRGAV